jgi:hypothetical protein
MKLTPNDVEMWKDEPNEYIYENIERRTIVHKNIPVRTKAT